MTEKLGNYTRSYFDPALGKPPRVWFLCGHKLGDNRQLLALAEALGWPYSAKRFFYRPYELLVGRWKATLLGIDRRRSDPLTPPWPDLILTAGRRNEPVALWIREQAAKIGHLVRIVHIGRPWAKLSHFDLIVTTPQYCLPPWPNVRYNTFPLHDLTQTKLEQAAQAWRERIHVPAPWLALLVGGSSGPYVFDRRAAIILARQASALAQKRSASLLVTTSARTAPEAAKALVSALEVPAEVHLWQPDKDNPYLGYLALAEEIIVTGDSMSMLAEACFTGKPVHIFPFGAGRWAMRPEAPLASQVPFWHRDRLRALRSALALTLAPRRLKRDVRCILWATIESGRAVWLGEEFRKPAPAPTDELAQTVTCVKALLGS
ncbi:MAG: mitochondrial fission ELM1 family protein [Methylohalobius sp.]|nr:mitochondrial fission ELM1 family protein [Methylohalobius sp.]